MIRLQPNERTGQLFLDDKPFLILGGELGNSSASYIEGLAEAWPHLKRLNLNTVLLPVYWELLEPAPGEFDFQLLDTALAGAREYDLHLILLWFGSWKNSMSCYAPEWIKRDIRQYPRVRLANGRPLEILSAHAPANWEADARAFAALMQHLQHVDSQQQTVLMVQVENEVAMLEQARDHSELAEAAFHAAVPADLLTYLQEHRAELSAPLSEAWEAQGCPRQGSWEELFGSGLHCEEFFTAWYYACYVNRVARAGRAASEVPLFVNAALNRPGLSPGQYPTGGPLPHLYDIWRAGAPAIDLLTPDIYFTDFTTWCARYERPGNPLFVPEARNTPDCGVKALYAIGRHRALGFSPFAIDTLAEDSAVELRCAYALLQQLRPLLLASGNAGEMSAVLLDDELRTCSLELGGYVLTAAHEHTLSWSAGLGAEEYAPSGALILASGPDEFFVAGTCLYITFASSTPGEMVGLLSVEEGEFVEGNWQPRRRLNGDESHQGRHVRFDWGHWGIQKVRLYRYR